MTLTFFLPVMIPTGAGAMRILGCFIRLVMAVKLAITLPLLIAQATAIGAAELIRATCRIF